LGRRPWGMAIGIVQGLHSQFTSPDITG
jgi:hypothetical protein